MAAQRRAEGRGGGRVLILVIRARLAAVASLTSALAGIEICQLHCSHVSCCRVVAGSMRCSCLGTCSCTLVVVIAGRRYLALGIPRACADRVLGLEKLAHAPSCSLPLHWQEFPKPYSSRHVDVSFLMSESFAGDKQLLRRSKPHCVLRNTRSTFTQKHRTYTTVLEGSCVAMHKIKLVEAPHSSESFLPTRNFS